MTYKLAPVDPNRGRSGWYSFPPPPFRPPLRICILLLPFLPFLPFPSLPSFSSPGSDSRVIIESASTIVCVLEAMKTEVLVCAGEEHVGMRVVGVARGVKVGGTVRAGQRLVYFE